MLVGEIEIAIDVGHHFDALGVAWVIGGSVASSLLGEPRATADVDIVADLRPVHVHPFYLRLNETYYIDEDAMRWAVRDRRTFNVIHFESTTKVDIYVGKDDPLSRGQMERRIFVEAAGAQLPICSAEDIILQKLLWFEQGARVSDRQWRDVLGVARVNRERLDRSYLDGHARANGLADLLTRLLADAEGP